MTILKDPTLEEIKRYTKDENGVTFLDGEIIRIPATRDYMFKNLFGINGKEENLRNLLQAILKIKIKSVEIQNPELKRNYQKDKKGVLDVRAKLADGTICFIEMQVKDEHNLGERATFYICKLYTSTIESGGKYIEIGKTIAIIITDFSFFNRKEFHQIAHLKFEECTDPNKIVENELNEAESEIITDKLELHIIDLKKFRKIKEPKGELADWLKLIIGDEEGIYMASKKNEAIKKANVDNRILSLDKGMQDEYWYELKATLIRNSEAKALELEEKARREKEKARKKQFEEEMKAAKEQFEDQMKAAKEQFEDEKKQFEMEKKIVKEQLEEEKKTAKEQLEEEKIQIVKKMLSKGYKIEEIADLTEINKEEIQKIKENENI